MTPEERFTKIEAQTEKNVAAIRDLIAVSRTIVDAQLRNEAEIKELRESQKDTDVKLRALIAAVDKMVRQSSNGKKQ